MTDVLPFPSGGYRFLMGVFHYSAGVAAEPEAVLRALHAS